MSQGLGVFHTALLDLSLCFFFITGAGTPSVYEAESDTDIASDTGATSDSVATSDMGATSESVAASDTEAASDTDTLLAYVT